MAYSARKIVLTLWTACLLGCSIIACQQQPDYLPYYNSPSFDPIFISNKDELSQEVSHTIGDFEFTNQNGQQISQRDIEGKIHVANFIFTTCSSICPKMTSHMKTVSTTFYNHPEVTILSYSVTPWIDEVPVLKTYADDNNITANNWHLLTGNRTKIYALARQSYFAEEDLGFTKDSTEFLHTEHFILVDRNKRIRGIYNGTLALEIKQLTDDINTLLKEN